MSYSVDELFGFKKTDNGYALADYRQKNDPSVTELELPAAYKGLPVASISHGSFAYSKHIKRVKIPGSVREVLFNAFYNIPTLEEVELSEGLELISNYAFARTGLKSVKLPKSLKELYWGAFEDCAELERAEFGGAPKIQMHIFRGCPKLPPETVAIGLVRSTDITTPVFPNDLFRMTDRSYTTSFDCFRPDVFELLAKNNCFQKCDLKHLFRRITDESKAGLFPIAEQHGMLESAALVDLLIEYSAENGKTEITAFLLDYKNRKFGFKGGGDLAI
ncbi:MAG: leucine-rich repeat domain-containing protein [Oscillospiraceae bacterium]|nr:leucine-rich repeat domain-containing protein [Oscillospiraceae bacterium]